MSRSKARPSKATATRILTIPSLQYISTTLFVLLAMISSTSAWPLLSFGNHGLAKRDVVCGAKGNADTICYPGANDTIYNSSWVNLLWNKDYPTYAQNPLSDIYIYWVEDNFRWHHIMNFTNITTANGHYIFETDNSYYAQQLTPGSGNQTFQYAVYIVGRGIDPDLERENSATKYPAASKFNFVENAPPLPNNTVANTTSLPKSTYTTSYSMPIISFTVLPDNGQNNLEPTTVQPWVIVIITAAGLAVLAAFLAAFYAFKATRKGKYDKKVYTAEPMIIAPNSKGHPGSGAYDNRDISSIHSTTPIIISHQRSPTNEGNVSIFSATTGRAKARQNSGGDKSYYSPSLSPSNSPQQLHAPLASAGIASEAPPIPQINEPRTSTSLLTSGDAIMIGDTFRQYLRKPDWQEQELNDLSSPIAEDTEEDDDERRRRLGDELLRKELAEEGTPMQRVERKATQLHRVESEKQGVVLGGLSEE
ncbi:hypothetical protein BC936DRAFT_143839 [Jimgerdemannia flammicorona]|uniref:Uncharacterized protein n=1 Tax=Jimgerdemannia flammicorona TaxID=994334 RepID=A0A433DMA0_9FUNG|nr:hypothetical protein BC936DRAFT_143839 [Jimgerdemannia flammicorona]